LTFFARRFIILFELRTSHEGPNDAKNHENDEKD